MCNLKAAEALMVGAYNLCYFRSFQIHDWTFSYINSWQVHRKSLFKWSWPMCHLFGSGGPIPILLKQFANDSGQIKAGTLWNYAPMEIWDGGTNKATLLHFLALRIPEPFFSVLSPYTLYSVNHSQVLRIVSWLILCSGYKYPFWEYGFKKEA